MEEKVVIITGGGSGIGKAAAILFAKNGYRVLVVDVDKGSADSVAEALTLNHAKAESFQVDVSDHVQVADLIDQVVRKYGKIDLMINNAGVANNARAKTAEHSLDDWDRVVSINQTGVFYCMKYALRQMVEQGHGNIINIASLAGLKASGHNLAYSASKFAVVGMTKSAALEYASANIRINCVCPGYTVTPLFEEALKGGKNLEERLLTYIPMRRYGQPEEIAETILWLASEKTSYITGQAITLDGGISL